MVPAHLNAFDLINDYNYDAPSPEDRRLIFRFMKKQRTEQRARQFYFTFFSPARFTPLSQTMLPVQFHVVFSRKTSEPMPTSYFLIPPAGFRPVR